MAGTQAQHLKQAGDINMNIMTDTNVRIRSVLMNDRGQIVIPEDMRNGMKLGKKEALILIERGNEIIIRKESAVAEKIRDEEKAWKAVSMESLRKAWGKEDEIWDKIAEEDLK